MWDATPGHATPGHATPGRETPGHDKGASSRRNRWDETPKTERGILYAFSVKRNPEMGQFLVISLRKIYLILLRVGHQNMLSGVWEMWKSLFMALCKVGFVTCQYDYKSK